MEVQQQSRAARQAQRARELERAFQAGDLVVVCWEPGCTMHRLPHWDENEWVSRPQEKGYRQYSHGICRWHYQVYQQEVERFMASEVVATSKRASATALMGS